MSNRRIVSVIGARPQFVKAGVVSKALAAAGLDEAIVHTGQHYDDAMSGTFLQQLGIGNIVANLAVGSGSQADQTARIMTGFDDFLSRQKTRPDAVLVYGDTNSTIAAGLVTAKLGIPLVHVEAGLRSYNREMPEEVNRVVVDHLSDLLFCSSPVGVENLAKEGIVQRVHDVGDVMLDAFLTYSERTRRQPEAVVLPAQARGTFALATIHRPSNTDDPVRFEAILAALGRLGMPCLWPVHPRNAGMLKTVEVPASVICVAPVGYMEMVALLNTCALVVTDSGGLQKEAHWAKRPCITLRSETEWVETLEGGWNTLCDPQTQDIRDVVASGPTTPWRLIYGDGQSTHRIATHLKAFLEARA